MLFDSGSGGGPDLIVDDGGDATQVVILCDNGVGGERGDDGEDKVDKADDKEEVVVDVVRVNTVVEVATRGRRYVCGRREGGIVVVEVAIREEEVVVNTVEVKYVRSW
ncbi:hypothetical protein F2Q69_00048130 [Brassica cretica]|uniref:Uncharacterized protein n=1 Tax=Brassica cretica TaxID=69181 RepID=A0A8S9Q6N6_BRACR|nr:hypothetical protein F2Q69_00048130 [Brassica cretica]